MQEDVQSDRQHPVSERQLSSQRDEGGFLEDQPSNEIGQHSRLMNVENRELQDTSNNLSLLVQPPEVEERWHSRPDVNRGREHHGNERHQEHQRSYQSGLEGFHVAQPSPEEDSRTDRMPTYIQAAYPFPTQESNSSNQVTPNTPIQMPSPDLASGDSRALPSQSQENRTFSSVTSIVRETVEHNTENRHNQHVRNTPVQLARNPRYASYSRRLQTLQSMPPRVIQDRVNMSTLAGCGFFYAGIYNSYLFAYHNDFINNLT